MAIKEVPVHLYPFLNYGSRDSTSLRIALIGEQQENEEKALEALLQALDEQVLPELSQSALVMALASAFYRGAPWFKKHKDEIMNTILSSPAASYVAILSGAFRGSLAPLLDKVSGQPELVLELSQNSVLVNIATDTWFFDHLKPHPVYFAARLFLKGKSKEALDQLHKAAESHAISAGICLSLDPCHERSHSWLESTVGSAEAIYWAGKVWRAGGNSVSKHPHLSSARSWLRQSPQWLYAWIRDIAPEGAVTSIRELWPSVWGVELAVDLNVSETLVLELYNSKSLNPKDPVESALLLWASDFVSPPKL